MHQCIKFILFLTDTLHVSDGLSIHHQEFKTTSNRHMSNRYCCLLASKQYLFDKCLLLYVQYWTPDDGWKDRPKHV